MNFQILCEQFARLSRVAFHDGDHLDAPAGKERPDRPELKSIRLEYRMGKIYAAASNAVTIAVEYLGKTDQPDGYINVVADPALIAQCEAEAGLKSLLMITHDPITGYAMAMTTLGYMYPGDCNNRLEWPDTKSIFDFFVAPATESDSPLMMDAEWLARLGSTSPSGEFVFPREVKQGHPIIVRDRHDENWIGIFMLPPVKNIKYAVLPDWAK